MLMLLAGIMLLSINCGGGGSNPTLPPGDRDLSGLEGNWTVNLSYSGTIKGSDGSKVDIADSGTGTWIITRNKITKSDGEPFAWSYNGSTLYIQENATVADYDSDCGDIIGSIVVLLTIKISPGATIATISGFGNISMSSDYCGKASGKVNYSGNMSR